MDSGYAFALTREAKIAAKVRLGNILARDSTRIRRISDGLLADGETNDGRVRNELHELGLVFREDLLGDGLMDVAGNVVAVVHGASATLDARPASGVAAAKVC